MSKVPQFAEVAPAVPLPATGPQAYTYQLPPEGQMNIHKYSSVTIPFGRRTVSGVVTKLHNTPPATHLKTLSAISPTILTKQQVAFARWLARTSHGGFGYTLRLFQPPIKRLAKQPVLPIPRNVPIPKPDYPAALIDGHAARRCDRLKNLIEQHVKKGQQVLILTPEKWLAERLSYLLKTISPTLIHTDLRVSQIATIWQQIRAGHPHVIVGTQKALFLPFVNLGLIVVEEEQYPTHKLWDQYPRLHNIYGAKQLAYLHQAALMYTASFPSLRLRHALQNSTVKALVNKPITPRTSLIKYSFEDKVKHFALPNSFLFKLKRWFKNKDHILLFYNRRDANRIKQALAYLSLPLSHITLSTSAIFTAKPQQKFDRVAWLLPEYDLTYPDFRSGERALITLARLQQILNNRRSIVLVTRKPELVQVALTSPPAAAFANILKQRRQFSYPPYFDLVRLTVTAKTESAAMKKGASLRHQLDERLVMNKKESVKIRGPFQSFAPSSHNRAEAHILLAGSLNTLTTLYKDIPIDTADLAPERIL